MNDFTINFPFTKVDEVKRTVTGVATANNVDSQQDLMELTGSIEAFSNWPGNIREMHQPTAVGKMLSFRTVPVKFEGKIYDGIETTCYVSKGAESTWQKVLDGTLRGFSIGGGVIEKSAEYDHKTKQSVRRVKKYMLTELSLVDNPANPAALISMFKSERVDDQDTLIYKASDTPVTMETVFYCETDQVAKTDSSECSQCGHDMVDIGFVEEFNAEVVSKMVDEFELKKNGGVFKLQENTEDDTVQSMDDLTDSQKDTLVKRLIGKLFGDDEAPTASFATPNVTVNINADTLAKAISEPVSQEAEVVEEVVEKAAEVSEETETITKNTKEEDVADTETVETDTSDIVKALSGVLAEQLASFKEEISKSVDEKIEAVTQTVTETADKVEKFADTGATSKSTGEVEDEVVEPIVKVQNDSFWKGTFVPLPLVEALGYTS